MKSKSWKKLLGVVLAAALIATQIFAAIPASADTPTQKLVQTFETAASIGGQWASVVGADPNTCDGSTPISIVEEAGHGKVLSLIKTSTSANFKSGMILANSQGNGLGTVTSGEFYDTIISFDYKVVSANSSGWGMFMQQFFFDDNSYNYWTKGISSNRSVSFMGSNTSATSPEANNSAFKAISDGTWHTMSFAVRIKATATKTNPFLGFVFDIPAGQTCNILFDNFTAQFATGASFCLHSNSTEEFDITAGVVGETVDLPVPTTSEDYQFSGWYSDAELTTPYGSTVTANATSWGSKENAITHLYAKYTKLYDEMVQNFDSAESIGGEWGGQTVISTDTTYLSLQTEAGRGKVLKVNKSNASDSWGTGIRIARDAGENSLGDVVAGSIYNLIVTFDYKVEDAFGNGWGPYIERNYIYYTPYNYWSQGVATTYPVAFDNTLSADEPEAHYSSYRAICDGEWHTMSYKTTAKAIEKSANGAFVFTIKINSGDKFVACFDNFNIKKLETGVEASTVILHSNGGAEQDITTGIVGQRMSLPIPAREQANFLGWYSDVSCTVPAGNVYVSNTQTFGTKENAVTEYYAKWSPAFVSHSLVLDENIGVNFLMDLSALSTEEKDNSYMTFSVADSEEEFTQSFAEAFESNGKFGFTCTLNSLQMSKKIKPVFHYGNGETITGNPYSINDYTAYIIDNSSSFSVTYVDYATQLNNYFSSKDLIVDGTIDILDLVKAEYNSESDSATYDSVYLLNLSKAIMGIDKYLGDDIAEPIYLPEI